MTDIERLREIVIRKCQDCKGQGFIEDEPCLCTIKFNRLVALLIGGFPVEFIFRLVDKEPGLRFETGEKYFKWTIENYEEFLNSGLGLIFYDIDSEEVATYFVGKLLEKDYRIECGFNKDTVKLGVFTLELGKEKLVKVLVERKKRVMPSIICLESVGVLNSDYEFADVLGWDNKEFSGSDFKGCSAQVIGKQGNWKI